MVFRLSLRHPVFKVNGEAVQRRFRRFPYRHRPLLADVVQREAKQLADGFIGRKKLRGSGGFSQVHVKRFNRVRGVNNLADFRRMSCFV
jgi:hypothetical protein